MKHATRSLIALISLAPAAHAEQLVVAEAEYTHSAQTTKDSHYRVEPSAETPPDWTQPVDYAHGSVHVRLEVQTKPSDTPTRYQICFEMKQNYCCTAQAPIYTVAGVYEWDTAVEDLWRPGPVDFTQGIVQSALILKDTNNVKPAPENVGEATSQLYMPTDLHVVVTLVSNGDVYSNGDEPEPATGGNGGGGGTSNAGNAGATTMGGAGTPGGGRGGAGFDSGELGRAGSAASLAGSSTGGMAETAAGMAPVSNAAPAASAAGCSIGVSASGKRGAWLFAALLLAARRRRTPNG
jgi:hypothetical protein